MLLRLLTDDHIVIDAPIVIAPPAPANSPVSFEAVWTSSVDPSNGISTSPQHCLGGGEVGGRQVQLPNDHLYSSSTCYYNSPR